MTVAGYLFSGEQVEDLVKRKKDELAEGINSLTDVSTLRDDAALHGKAARIEPCILLRPSAVFDVDDSAPTVVVELTLPISGSTDLLHRRVPRSRGDNVLVEGEVLGASFWPGEEQKGPRVRISESVPTGTSPAAVREQARRSVDAMEANLALINAFVEGDC